MSSQPSALQFTLIPTLQYQQMKQLINQLSSLVKSFASTADRSSFIEVIQRVNKNTDFLQNICSQISQQFQDGKINKRTLQAQIQSLHINLLETKQQLANKNRQIIKYSSQLMKLSQQNDRIKDYIKKLKQQNKTYKLQMQQLVQSLSGKVKKYKSQYQQKIQKYETKIKYLETQLENSNRIGEDLDKELEELAMLEAEVQGDEQRQSDLPQ